MRVAVTGGSGNIGKHVCAEFRRAGHEVESVDKAPPPDDTDFLEVDLCKSEDTRAALRDFEAIVHLAAIPNPFSDPPEQVMSANMMTALNVFESAKANGTSRVVYGCSESSTGFGIHSVPLRPLYVPLDEEHPCWPHETYSLSKHFGERLADNYALAFGIEAISLRYTWVVMEQCREAIEHVVARARAGEVDEHPWFGAYISVKDVARACVLSADYEFPADCEKPHETFLLTAKNTYYPLPTLEVLRRTYGEVPPVKDPSYFEEDPFASVFDIRKAERLLGWTPEHDWRNFNEWKDLL
jgi:nucleoside-diphosphate-sugar epimerase